MGDDEQNKNAHQTLSRLTGSGPVGTALGAAAAAAAAALTEGPLQVLITLLRLPSMLTLLVVDLLALLGRPTECGALKLIERRPITAPGALGGG